MVETKPKSILQRMQLDWTTSADASFDVAAGNYGHVGWREFTVPKKNGKTRTITAPSRALKAWQRHHLAELETLATAMELRSDDDIGFKKGSGYPDAARKVFSEVDIRNAWMLNFDLDNFFPSIKRGRIAKLFQKLGYDGYTSRLMAQLHTKDGKLTQGNPASPLIASLAIRGMDTSIRDMLKRVEREWGCKTSYSRYADDLTNVISHTPEMTKDRVQQVLNSVFRISKGVGNVCMARSKVHCTAPTCKRAREVVGIKIVPTKDNFRFQPNRKTLHRERACNHWSKKHETWLPTTEQIATGTKAKEWVHMVRGYKANRTAVLEAQSHILRRRQDGYYSTSPPTKAPSKTAISDTFQKLLHIQNGYAGVILKQRCLRTAAISLAARLD